MLYIIYYKLFIIYSIYYISQIIYYILYFKYTILYIIYILYLKIILHIYVYIYIYLRTLVQPKANFHRQFPRLPPFHRFLTFPCSMRTQQDHWKVCLAATGR